MNSVKVKLLMDKMKVQFQKIKWKYPNSLQLQAACCHIVVRSWVCFLLGNNILIIWVIQMNYFTGIIYTFSKKESEDVTVDLQSRGVKAGCYHADLSPRERSRVHKAWIDNKIHVCIYINIVSLILHMYWCLVFSQYSIVESIQQKLEW